MSTPDQIKQMASGLFDRASATYDQTGNDFFGTFGRWVVEAAALQPGERVLDVGSGRGAVLLPAARAVGPDGRVEGVDLAPGMVERLRESLADLPQATVVLGDAEQPPVTGPYDAIARGTAAVLPARSLGSVEELLRAAAPRRKAGLLELHLRGHPLEARVRSSGDPVDRVAAGKAWPAAVLER